MSQKENKYYTPSIDELYVGFEVCTDTFPHILTDEDLKLLLNDYTDDKFIGKFGQGLFRLPYKFIRVKYLDQEDIESLGWELDVDQTYGNTLWDHYNLGEFWTLSCMKHNNSDLQIWNVNANNGNQSGFCFDIKNKSELKRLLKQLGIYEQ